MGMEDAGKPEEALDFFQQAWNRAENDFERFLASFFIARRQENPRERLQWLQKSLKLATDLDDDTVTTAYPTLYISIAKCYEELGASDESEKYSEQAKNFSLEPTDRGPFYHGTRADLHIGDLLTAGGDSNYKPDLKMNHIYFTGMLNGAGLAAALAQGEGRERIYIVEPTGRFENDPNVTDKKFPGNLTRSYRSQEPLRIVAEQTDWAKQMPEQIKEWREKLAKNKGEIIN
jgi:rifampin ADP-ribosylating transferase